MQNRENYKNLIDPHKVCDKSYFLELLDGDKQREFEINHLNLVMDMLKYLYINRLKERVEFARQEKAEIQNSSDYDAEKYKKILELNAMIKNYKRKMGEYKPLFDEPYFARMDVVDDKEGYNSYYIGKRGDSGLEIVDWRAPLAQKYYQKSRTSFSINDYNYKLILRRALRTSKGQLIDFKNEYLHLNDYLTESEIGGRDEELVFDPYLKEILRTRKEQSEISDIIATIQEKQYEIITLPENEQYILQGVAGSGKTMILLHRLSYIMYNNENIRKSDVLVLTPSDTFNEFIDELSTVLELEKVRTSTIDSYFLAMIKNVGVDLKSRIDYSFQIPEEYLKYIYSDKFNQDIDTALAKIYDGVNGMFTSRDCREVVDSVLSACKFQNGKYEKIKNASIRVRRCVLGEIKEKSDGGLFYNKPFRTLFNAVVDVEEFLTLIRDDERMRNYSFFYNQLLSFYKSLRYLRRYGSKILSNASEDLNKLLFAVGQEISDFKRYKMKLGDKEVLTYSTQIEHRQMLKKEIESIISVVSEISDSLMSTIEFAEVLKSDKYFVSIGKCENTVDVMRFFYREIVKKAKSKFKINLNKHLIRSDPFAMTLILAKLGYNLTPKYSFIFIDEAQDISAAEYYLLKRVNERAVFNIFGDLKQNITKFRGIGSWDKIGFKVYNLELNYRNTNQIVEYVSKNLGIEMRSIGFNGSEIKSVAARNVTAFLNETTGLKAIICSEKNREKYARKSYNILSETGKISKTKINLMTVYESKGLEFSAVVVDDSDLADNEKYVAYTRALKELALIV